MPKAEPKAKGKTAKPKKRGPKEERLIITEDPAVALAALLAFKPTKKR
jgi:hypothetical protein